MDPTWCFSKLKRGGLACHIALLRAIRLGVSLFLVACLFTFQSVFAQESNLLINGSFEEAPAVSKYMNVAAGSAVIQGWTVTGEAVDVVAGNYWPASDGNLSIDLDGSAWSRTTPPYMQGGVSQSFSTEPGGKYLVRFDLAGNPVKRPVVKQMLVSAAGESMAFSFDVTGRDFHNLGWLPQSWSFIAKEKTTTLEFRSLTVSPQTGYGPVIDNVVVSAVDTPHLLQVSEDETEIQVNLEAGVLFDTGKYDLKPEATEALQTLIALLKEHPDLPISIEGHTDSAGTPEANQTLSGNRAKTVSDWLISHGGIKPDRITTKGLGQTSPIAPNDTPEGRQKNRRVEIKLQKK